MGSINIRMRRGEKNSKMEKEEKKEDREIDVKVGEKEYGEIIEKMRSINMRVGREGEKQ